MPDGSEFGAVTKTVTRKLPPGTSVRKIEIKLLVHPRM